MRKIYACLVKTQAQQTYPQAVLLQIEQLAHNIAVARKRRGETQAQWAKRLGVSQPTFARIERGDPGVAMASYVMCMWLIDPERGSGGSGVAPLNDQSALEREVSKASQKGRRSRADSKTQAAVAKASAPQEAAKCARVNRTTTGGSRQAVTHPVGPFG